MPKNGKLSFEYWPQTIAGKIQGGYGDISGYGGFREWGIMLL